MRVEIPSRLGLGENSKQFWLWKSRCAALTPIVHLEAFRLASCFTHVEASGVVINRAQLQLCFVSNTAPILPPGDGFAVCFALHTFQEHLPTEFLHVYLPWEGRRAQRVSPLSYGQQCRAHLHRDEASHQAVPKTLGKAGSPILVALIPFSPSTFQTFSGGKPHQAWGSLPA